MSYFVSKLDISTPVARVLYTVRYRGSGVQMSGVQMSDSRLTADSSFCKTIKFYFSMILKTKNVLQEIHLNSDKNGHYTVNACANSCKLKFVASF